MKFHFFEGVNDSNFEFLFTKSSDKDIVLFKFILIGAFGSLHDIDIFFYYINLFKSHIFSHFIKQY